MERINGIHDLSEYVKMLNTFTHETRQDSKIQLLLNQYLFQYFFPFFITVEYFSIFVNTASVGDKNQRF